MENEQKMQNEAVQKELEELRANPARVRALLVLIGELFNVEGEAEKQKSKQRKMEEIIHNHLLNIGISPSLRGYHYLMTAIKVINEKPECVKYFTGYVYPEVAARHGVTPAIVGNSIRTAVETAWTYTGDIVTLDRYFKNTISRQRGKPTNKQFVLTLYEDVKRDMK